MQTTTMQCLFFRETKIHPWVIRARKSLRVKFCFIGIFWRNLHGRLVFFTAETFKNLHGHFSRATENFRKSSRVGAKISRTTCGRNFKGNKTTVSCAPAKKNWRKIWPWYNVYLAKTTNEGKKSSLICW